MRKDMKKYSFEAVIFDLDGVITRTAKVHAQAWKRAFDEYMRLREQRDGEPFREFTHNEDYLPYVDGKPRYQGVKSFLESRGIDIPFGELSDASDKETACGLGNRKNAVFVEILKKQGAEVFSSSIEFIKALKEVGIRIGVASSSKNCKFILESTGIEELFETRVDGEVSVELGLKGKPEGDIFVRAARNLGVLPAKAVVVEDAVSGVQAGRNGGFELVLGVAREDNEAELLKEGADVVVRDLSEIDIEGIEKWFHRRPKALIPPYPSLLKGGEGGFKRLVLFLDYDGTLTPIVDRPELAVIDDDMKALLKRLSEKWTVAVVSGRMREDVEKLVGIDGLLYAGSHGFDISGQGISIVQDKAKEAMPAIAKVVCKLKEKLGGISGVLVEEKKFSVAVHYRLVDEARLPEIESVVEDIIRDYTLLRLMRGKKVFEILPDIDWDKGKAIKWIMEALKISWSETSVIYIGDDVTDEDAFRVIRTRGTGILVSQENRESAADFQLASVDEVKRLFGEFLLHG